MHCSFLCPTNIVIMSNKQFEVEVEKNGGQNHGAHLQTLKERVPPLGPEHKYWTGIEMHQSSVLLGGAAVSWHHCTEWTQAGQGNTLPSTVGRGSSVLASVYRGDTSRPREHTAQHCGEGQQCTGIQCTEWTLAGQGNTLPSTVGRGISVLASVYRVDTSRPREHTAQHCGEGQQCPGISVQRGH